MDPNGTGQGRGSAWPSAHDAPLDVTWWDEDEFKHLTAVQIATRNGHSDVVRTLHRGPHADENPERYEATFQGLPVDLWRVFTEPMPPLDL